MGSGAASGHTNPHTGNFASQGSGTDTDSNVASDDSADRNIRTCTYIATCDINCGSAHCNI